MDFEQFKQEFLIACDFIEEPVLAEDTPLDGIPDFDSLAMLGVIVMLETQFGLTASGEDVMRLGTMGGLHKFATKQ